MFQRSMADEHFILQIKEVEWIVSEAELKSQITHPVFGCEKRGVNLIHLPDEFRIPGGKYIAFAFLRVDPGTVAGKNAVDLHDIASDSPDGDVQFTRQFGAGCNLCFILKQMEKFSLSERKV